MCSVPKVYFRLVSGLYKPYLSFSSVFKSNRTVTFAVSIAAESNRQVTHKLLKLANFSSARLAQQHLKLLRWLKCKQTTFSIGYCTLQKQVSCFNHRVVTMVTDKLRRLVMRSSLLVLNTNCIRQPRRQLPSSSYNHNALTTLITSVIPSSGSLLQHLSAFVMTPSQMFLGLSVYCGCKMNWPAASLVALSN